MALHFMSPTPRTLHTFLPAPREKHVLTRWQWAHSGCRTILSYCWDLGAVPGGASVHSRVLAAWPCWQMGGWELFSPGTPPKETAFLAWWRTQAWGLSASGLELKPESTPPPHCNSWSHRERIWNRKGDLCKERFRWMAAEDGWSLPEQPETILLLTQLKALTRLRKE